MADRHKIAILGGGMGAISAAWAITAHPDWQQHYEVTVYQRGWRLGGKAASGRNMACYGRVEECGTHIWSGSFTNALGMVRDCYAALAEFGLRRPEAPLGTFEKAFKPLHHLFVPELVNSPDGNTTAEPWRIKADAGAAPNRPASAADLVRCVSNLLAGLLHEAGATEFGKDLPGELPAIRNWLHTQGPLAEADTARRRMLTVLDLGTAALEGMIAEDVAARRFDHLDRNDIRDWLARHGASHEALASSIMAAAEGFAFGYPGSHRGRGSISAGIFLHNLCRTAFAVEEALFFQMQSGSGDTVFAPLYQVLQARGVRFRFFHAVTGLHPSHDGKSLAKIQMIRQAELLPPYDPLVTVRNLPCWPSAPLWDQLRDGERLQREAPCLEDESQPLVGEPLTLHAGADFDEAILGIGIGALPDLAWPLAEVAPAWAAMLAEVQAVAVRTAQVWLTVPSAEYGWKQLVDADNPASPSGNRPLQTLAAGLPGAFGTWTDASGLIGRADWGDDDRPWSIAAFTGILPEPPDGGSQCEGLAAWLEECMGLLWPHMRTQDGGFLYSTLHDPQGRSGADRLGWQFVQAGEHGSQRQTLTAPGALEYRLPPDDSGFTNLYLAGDWTRNDLNAPSAEAAAISGIMAASALSKRV